jgi:hypothetical protein
MSLVLFFLQIQDKQFGASLRKNQRGFCVRRCFEAIRFSKIVAYLFTEQIAIPILSGDAVALRTNQRFAPRNDVY